MANVRVKVKSELLRWARERARLSMAELESRFPRLDDWESGAVEPTLKQLEAYAKATRAPIGYLFLEEPPHEQLPIPDFRTVGGTEVSRPSPDLLETIYNCQERQDWYREYVRETGGERCEYVSSATLESPVVETAASIRSTLGIDLEQRSQFSTWDKARSELVVAADTAGILVLVSGIVMNNTHRKLEPKEFRGFALADEYAPLIFINGSDSKSAQMFTLAHELAHIWLGQSAVSDTTVASRGQNAVERWCNRVAAEMLAPLSLVTSHLRALREGRGELSLDVAVDVLVRTFKVSSLVVLQRLRDVRFLTAEQFNDAYSAETGRLASLSKQSSGGDFYLTAPIRHSRRFTRALFESATEGRTLYRDAFKLLGISKTATFMELGQSLAPGL